MHLRHIVMTACPDCGCVTVVAEESRNRHTNGEDNERREFACGSVYHWLPNYSKLENSTPCPASAASRAKAHRRHAAKAKLLDFIDGMDQVDDKWKTWAKEAVRYLNEGHMP